MLLQRIKMRIRTSRCTVLRIIFHYNDRKCCT